MRNTFDFAQITQNILIFKRKSLQILQKYGHFVVTLQIINIEIGMGIIFQLFIIEKKILFNVNVYGLCFMFPFDSQLQYN